MNNKSIGLLLGLAFALAAIAPVQAQQTPTPATQAAPEEEVIAEDDATEETPATPATPASTPPMRDPTAADPAKADPALLPVYRQFGEEAGLVALMDEFMVLLLADERTRPFFENADQAGIKKHLVEQFCVILGGPCTYTGRDMKSSHANLGIDRGSFNALVEDLQIAMNKRKIPFAAQNKLLAKLAPMHREIETL